MGRNQVANNFSRQSHAFIAPARGRGQRQDKLCNPWLFCALKGDGKKVNDWCSIDTPESWESFTFEVKERRKQLNLYYFIRKKNSLWLFQFIPPSCTTMSLFSSLLSCIARVDCSGDEAAKIDIQFFITWCTLECQYNELAVVYRLLLWKLMERAKLVTFIHPRLVTYLFRLRRKKIGEKH